MKALLKISFDGSRYCGFQCQKNGVAVQNVMTEAAARVFGKECLVTGCSRTDAGVHALGFCCTAEPSGEHGEDWCRIPLGRIHRAFASVLPEDISVVGAAAVPDDFHPRYDVLEKTYIYRIWDAPYDNPFEKGRSGRCIFRITPEKEKAVAAVCKAFEGRHDFSSFMASGSKITDPVREVTDAHIYREDSGALVFSVTADGFLYNMVRIMAGTLIDCAAGRISQESISDIIASRDRNRAGYTAPPCGLYLSAVKYNRSIIWECN